jgi:hypothetical protein
MDIDTKLRQLPIYKISVVGNFMPALPLQLSILLLGLHLRDLRSGILHELKWLLFPLQLQMQQLRCQELDFFLFRLSNWYLLG